MISIIGIDPSLNDTAIAVVHIEKYAKVPLQIQTKHIKKLSAGMYTDAIKQFQLDCGFNISAGIVEDFSKVGGPHTNKTAIKAVSHAGGMAEEAIVAAGIPMVSLTITEWRKEALGKAEPHITRTGRMLRYWTKGASNVPSNVAPALLKLFRYSLKLEEFATGNYQEFFKKNDPRYEEAKSWTWDDAIKHVASALSPVSSRRIQIVFGKSIDELEAAAIACAGFKMISGGELKGIEIND